MARYSTTGECAYHGSVLSRSFLRTYGPVDGRIRIRDVAKFQDFVLGSSAKIFGDIQIQSLIDPAGPVYSFQSVKIICLSLY
jgi:hypothetical protein